MFYLYLVKYIGFDRNFANVSYIFIFHAIKSKIRFFHFTATDFWQLIIIFLTTELMAGVNVHSNCLPVRGRHDLLAE